MARTVKEVWKSDDGIVAAVVWMMLCVPLQNSDADHRTHHADQTNLKPSFASKTVEEEDGYPGRNK